jgi:hypothetical protein
MAWRVPCTTSICIPATIYCKRADRNLQITGSSLYTEWFPFWLLDYALLHSAIIVCPNYRLMPEVAGLDFKTDVFASWTWAYNDLQTYLGKNVEVDMDRVLVEGEEAGLCMTSSRGRASLTIYRWLPSDTICFDPRRQRQSNDRCFFNDRSQDPFIHPIIRKEHSRIPRASWKCNRDTHVAIERRGDRIVCNTA